MRTRARCGAIVAFVLLGCALPAAAGADSIVYLKDGDVWIAQPDGSGARQFTGGHTWASPSEADDGTVVAVGGLERVNVDGSDSGGDSELYRFQANGTQIGNPIPTWGSYSTPQCPTMGPYSAQVSPDGSKIAYGIHECGDNSETALWTPSNATGLQFPGQTIGQDDYYEPSWIDSTHFVVSHAGSTVTDSQARWFVHDVADSDQVGTGWLEPGMTAPSAQAVISRDGKRMAVFTSDASDDLDAKPRNVQVWLYTSRYASYPGPGQAWDYQCPSSGSGTPIALDASKVSQPLRLDPSFSPDGSKLLWGDDEGVEVAAVPAGTDCSAFSPHLLIPGGSQPFYAKGNLQAAATVVTIPAPALNLKAAFNVAGKHLSTRKKVVFDAGASTDSGGHIASYRWSFGDHQTARGRKVAHRFRKAKTYKVKLTIVDAGGRKASVTHAIHVRRR